MRILLSIVALILVSSTVFAAACPPGTKHQCVQSKKGSVVCSCH